MNKWIDEDEPVRSFLTLAFQNHRQLHVERSENQEAEPGLGTRGQQVHEERGIIEPHVQSVEIPAVGEQGQAAV